MSKKRKEKSVAWRCNNPLHIPRCSLLWQGLAPEQKDRDLLTFKNRVWGYRAAFVMMRYHRNHLGVSCLKEMVRYWLPDIVPEDMEIRIRQVAALAGVDPEEPVDERNPWGLLYLVAAISRIRNQEVVFREVLEGWRLYQG